MLEINAENAEQNLRETDRISLLTKVFSADGGRRVGPMVRGERLAKCNQLLRNEEELQT